MKKRRTAFFMASLMLISTVISPWSGYGGVTALADMTAEAQTLEQGSYVLASAEARTATETNTGSDVTETNLDFMSADEYASLGFTGLADSSTYVDDEYDPLEGYQPQILNELYIGHLNHPDDYKGYFATAENVSSIYKEGTTEVNTDVLNLNNMQNANVGGKQAYYDYSDMQTQCINVISMYPGDLTAEDAEIGEEILIESRLYQDTYKRDSSHQRVQAFSKVNGSWTGGNAIVSTLADRSDWVGDITIREQGGFNAMAVGDFDQDGYNEVAVHEQTGNNDGGRIFIYQPQLQSGGSYNLVSEGQFWIKNLGSQFNWGDGSTRPMVSMTTTDMAGHDALVVSVTLPYDDHDKACNNGVVAVVECTAGEYKAVWSDSLVIGDNSRFKLQNVLSVDLNCDGQNEIFIAGHINTGYTNGSKRGSIDGSNMYANVLVYDASAGYHLVWQDDEVKKVPRHPDLHVDNSSGDGDSENDPITLSSGKYAEGQSIETIFCEGVFLDFTPDASKEDPIEQIRNGSFTHDASENLEFSNTDEAFIGQIATGCFSETERTIEQTVVFHGHNALGDDTCDLNYTWFYGSTNDEGNTTIAQVKYDDYINDADEDGNGTCVVLSAVNVDSDSCYIKHTERCYGYSNPGILAVLISAPYWDELNYGSESGSRGETSFSVSYSNGNSTTNEGSVGFDLHIGIGVFATGGGVGAEVKGGGGLDVDFATSYVHSKTRGTTETRTLELTGYAGEDTVALTVIPIVSDYYEMKESVNDSEAELLVVNTTYDPAFTCISVDQYNNVATTFNNGQGENEDLLTIIDLDEVFYEGYVAGDPSTYPSTYNDIPTIFYEDGEPVIRESNLISVNATAAAGYTTTFSSESSYTKTNGVELSLGIGTHQEYEAAACIPLVASAGAYFEMDTHVTGGYSYTYATTESEEYTYTGKIYSLPAAAQTGTDINGNPTSDYAYSAKMIQWDHTQNAILESETGEVAYKAIPYIGYLTTTYIVPPRRVTDLSVVRTTKHSAQLEWTKPTDRNNNGETISVDYYKIYISESLNGEYTVVQQDWQDMIVDGDATTCLVSELESDTTYYFKIQSISESSAHTALSDAARGTTLATGAPIITKHPASQTIMLWPHSDMGNGYSFSVEATPYHEDSELLYQWQKWNEESGDWEDIWGKVDKTYSVSTTYQEDGGLEVRCVVTEVHADQITVTSIPSYSAELNVIGYMDLDHSKEQTQVNIYLYPHESGEDINPSYATGECYQVVGESIDVLGQVRTAGYMPLGKRDTPFTGKVYLYDTKNGRLVDGYPKEITYGQVPSWSDGAMGDVNLELSGLEAGEYYLWMGFDDHEYYHGSTSGTSIINIVEKTDILYELNGGTNYEGNPTWCSEYWEDALLFQDPTKENAIFEGWYLDSRFETKVHSNSGFYEGVGYLYPSEIKTNPLTLYAKWKELEVEYSVTYELNGGVNAETNPTTIKSNEKIGLSAPTKIGYAFEGWYLDSEFMTPCTEISGEAGQDITVYAKWGAPIEYQIQYVLGDGVNAESNPTSYTIESGDITFADAAWEGYAFAGWYTSADYTTQVTGIPSGSTGTVVVYAKWNKTTTLDDEDGDGVYEIASYEDLVEMAEMIQLDPETYAAADYIQTQNINCMMQPWKQEIGSLAIPFEGTYEGNDYYILGLRPESYVTGLFGVIGENGVVQNALVVDFDYSEPALMASGFAGINRGTINGCGSGVNLTSAGTTFLYGNDNPVTISELDSNILGIETAGGLVAINEGTITNSRSSAEVTISEEDKDSVAGGIAAENTGVLCNIFNTGVISGADVAGGIVGDNSGSIQYGYTNTAVTGTVVGAVAGNSQNTNISDFWYADTMSAACGNAEDSQLTNITAMALADMATSTFKDTLNTAIEGEGLTAWTQATTKNAGYPRLESSVVVNRTITSSSGNASVSGRIHPDAKVVFMKLTDGDPEYLSLMEWLEKDGLKEGWKLSLVYEDGTMAVWEGDLTIQIKPENIDQIKDLALVYYDVNGEHKFPNVKIEGDTLIIQVDEMGSFAIAESSDVKTEPDGKDETDDTKPGSTKPDNTKPDNKKPGSGTSSKPANTGDAAVILPYILLMTAAAFAIMGAVVLVIKKRKAKEK